MLAQLCPVCNSPKGPRINSARPNWHFCPQKA